MKKEKTIRRKSIIMGQLRKKKLSGGSRKAPYSGSHYPKGKKKKGYDVDAHQRSRSDLSSLRDLKAVGATMEESSDEEMDPENPITPIEKITIEKIKSLRENLIKADKNILNLNIKIKDLFLEKSEKDTEIKKLAISQKPKSIFDKTRYSYPLYNMILLELLMTRKKIIQDFQDIVDSNEKLKARLNNTLDIERASRTPGLILQGTNVGRLSKEERKAKTDQKHQIEQKIKLLTKENELIKNG